MQAAVDALVGEFGCTLGFEVDAATHVLQVLFSTGFMFCELEKEERGNEVEQAEHDCVRVGECMGGSEGWGRGGARGCGKGVGRWGGRGRVSE
jgi:hypothetical protein